MRSPYIKFQAGELKALGYDKSGKNITEDLKKTKGEQTAIRLTSHVSPNGFRADGHDIALVDVEVVDKDGNRCPTALSLINFTILGEAESRGGIAQGESNYILSKSLLVENGVNRVLIRSTRNAGRISLKAISENLRSAEIELISKLFQSENGLSLLMPFENLPVNLSRGATPIGESFKMSRQAINVSDVSADSNSDQAKNSFDDNEVTDWSSYGKPENAWIKYEFAETKSVNQAVLKLIGRRTNRYPIQILVNDKQVFLGTTPRSLGYVTLFSNNFKQKHNH
jgi:beta-galactosidase